MTGEMWRQLACAGTLCFAAQIAAAEPARHGAFATAEPEAAASLPFALRAEFSGPTDRYPHDVLGRIAGWTTLTITAQICGDCPAPQAALRIVLPETGVFEDIAPRLWDITGDGQPEVVVVESDANRGARLTVWQLRDGDGGAQMAHRLATTDFIGTRFRWLAPLGAADFTGDGRAEIALVDRPHLARILRLVAWRGDRLVTLAELPGVTNHRIGEEHITGGIRTCEGVPEVIAVSADWQRLLAVRLDGGALAARDIGRFTGPGSVAAALACTR
jgi:hypothetical protein